MNKRQVKKLMKRNQIKFNRIKLNKDDVLVIDFKEQSDCKYITKVCDLIHNELFPNNKILPLHDGMSIGVIERGDVNGNKN